MIIEKEKLLDKKHIRIVGRFYFDKESLHLYNSDSAIKMQTNSKTIKYFITSKQANEENNKPYFSVVIDDNFSNPTFVCMDKTPFVYELRLDGCKHDVAIYKNNEATNNHVAFNKIELDGELFDYTSNKKVAQIVGDSTFAGYGVYAKEETIRTSTNSNGLEDYAFQALSRLNYEVHAFTASGWGVKESRWTEKNEEGVLDHIHNVCVNDDTPWDDSLLDPTLILHSLGTNDMNYIYMQGITEAETQRRYKLLVDSYVELLQYELSTFKNADIVMIYGSINETRIFPAIEEVYDILKDNKRLHLIKVIGDSNGLNGHETLQAHKEISYDLEDKLKKELGL